jgi:hypothetical protein
MMALVVEKVTEIMEGGEIFYGNGSSGMADMTEGQERKSGETSGLVVVRAEDRSVRMRGFNNSLRYQLVIGDLYD